MSLLPPDDHLRIALGYKEILDTIRIVAYRLRSFSNYILDLICLQTVFEIVDKSQFRDQSFLQTVSNLGLKEVGQFVFISNNLKKNPSLLQKFCITRVNHSADLAEEVMVIFKPTSSAGQIVLNDNLISDFVSNAPFNSITIVTKSSIRNRLLAKEIESIPGLQKVDHPGALLTSHKAYNHVCVRRNIEGHLLEATHQMHNILTSLTFDQKQALGTHNLSSVMDHSVYLALYFTVQVLTDAPLNSKLMQKTFEDYIEKAVYWMKFHLNNYIGGVEKTWSSYFLVKQFEFLNTLFLLKQYYHPVRWEDEFKCLEVSVINFRKNLPKNPSHLETYIIDQAAAFLAKSGISKFRLSAHHTNQRYPDQRFLEMNSFIIMKMISNPISTIYKCLDSISRKIVIIKRLPIERNGSRKEINLLFALRHPNIVKYINAIEDQKYMFLIMEFCENKLTSTPMENDPSERYLRCVGRQILSGLNYLHSNHIVHRDVKPDNILTNGAGFVKIADFGEAKFQSHYTSDDRKESIDLYGTPAYMAPECVTDVSRVSYAADIWSFALVLAYLISNEHPWSNITRQFEIILELQSQQRLPINVEALKCSEDIRKIIALCLKFNPNERPSAAELLSNPYFLDAPESLI